ncbi:DUF2313 domain-containing protein [Anaerotruncus sp. 1XD22-93]|nr:DUF2313 domain-containing protein [Lachnospiraceae bacterium]NBI76337.1 DUF2313 domain-containing protein [Lachnospiraceae bacterium]RKJ81087.1 DUF2313 domain-containing protein [Anaerotruncus sp. 1XD22-93]
MNLENFPESASAVRMLGMVDSGWYDRSYVGKWLFQVMGMEMDRVKEKFDELRQQAFAGSATWGLAYWEKKYGLLDGGVLTEDERHRRIKERQQVKYSMNPERLRQIAELVCGKEVEVSEPGPYTFRLKVIIRGSDGSFHEGELREKIRQIKPAHLACEIVTERPITGHICTGAVMQQAEIINIRQVV